MADSKIAPIPDGYPAVTPYLCCKNGAAALDFYKRAFGAVETMCMKGPDGKIGHAEFRVGNSPVMMADECPDMGFLSPATIGGAGVNIMMYVDDVDTVFKRALGAGAEELRPVRNEFYGDRTGTLRDPFGHVWHVATHVEDVAPDELERRAREAMSKKP
ncbi:VOC family protein [Uliginosibacterium sp. sgz301328]|uniref:VOC family protein n=1 Tax=Uliginosibacterium sp. sgz301328 TaxID=3243764 RepID=UPI00359DB85A